MEERIKILLCEDDENHTATYRRAYDKRENLLKALNGTL